MNRNTYNPIIIDLSDIIAFALKKFLLIVIFCVICMALSIGVHFISANSEGSIEKYNTELEEYESALNNAENMLDVLESRKSGIIQSREEDPVSELYNSKSVYVSKITFKISSEDDMVISESGTLIYPNQDSLLGFFNSLNLSGVLGCNIKNDYLRNLVLVSAQANYIEIMVYNQDQDVSRNWAGKIYDELYSFATVDYDWTVSGKADSTESYYGQYVVSIVEKYNSSLVELEELITKQTKEIKALKSQRPGRLHLVRFAAIGFVAGGFLCLAVLVLIYVKRNPVTKTFSAEKKIGKPFLGALFADNDLFDKVARSVIGERKYQSENEAIEYLRSSIRNNTASLQGNGVVSILCSCSGKLVEKQVSAVESALKEAGFTAAVVTDAPTNPESSDIIKGSDAVVILERQWMSQWKLVFVDLELAERCEKPVIGFVLC